SGGPWPWPAPGCSRGPQGATRLRGAPAPRCPQAASAPASRRPPPAARQARGAPPRLPRRASGRGPAVGAAGTSSLGPPRVRLPAAGAGARPRPPRKPPRRGPPHPLRECLTHAAARGSGASAPAAPRACPTASSASSVLSPASHRYAERHIDTPRRQPCAASPKGTTPPGKSSRLEKPWPKTAAPGAGGHRVGDSGTALEDAAEDSPDLVGTWRVGREDRECGIRQRVTDHRHGRLGRAFRHGFLLPTAVLAHPLRHVCPPLLVRQVPDRLPPPC